MRHEDEKNTSSICFTMCSSSGQWLNGAMVPQHHYVSLTLKDPDDKIVARVALTFEQMTRALMYNGEVPCTLERYRGLDGKLIEEQVEKPKTVHRRMKERLGESRKELADRIADLHKDIYEALQAGTAGKKKLQELLSQSDTIKQHFASNDDFVVQQAEEELGAMQTQAACQLGVFLQSQHGISADSSVLQKLLPVSENNLLEDKSTDVKPVVTGYVPKERDLKEVKDMTAMEVADEINKWLKIAEAFDPDIGKESAQLFGSNATSKRNKVEIRYISYQGTHSLTLEAAQEYLTYLRTHKEFKRHSR